MGMKTRCNLSDILAQLSDAPRQVEQVFDTIGEDAVGYAKEHGNYKNHTWNLRTHNMYERDQQHLVVKNTMPYASNVEHKGYDVLTGAEYYVQDKYNLKQ